MKTSIRLSALLLGLILALSGWAQDEAQGQDDGPESAAEQVTGQADEQPEEAVAEDAGEAEDAGAAAESEGLDAGATNAAGQDQAEASEASSDQAAAPAPAVPEAAETFIFQGHPIFPPETAELVYRPLVNYLNDVLPYRFDLELAPDYHRYWLSTRRGENPHIVLEEPHLTAYRIQQYNYTPLVRADAPITYSLLTSMNNAESSVREFIGRRVSTMPAPSLGYLILTNWFDNPMQQPIIQSNASSWLDAVEIVFSQEADAAIVPHNLVSRYVNMANVLTSQEFPGVTIAASPEVPIDIQEEIREALLTLHENDEHFAALNELDISQFIEARSAQYEGLEEWLTLVYSTL